MKRKILFISLLLTILLPTKKVFALLPPSFVVNDEQRICKTYWEATPKENEIYQLPPGWRYFDTNENWETACQSLGYTYSSGYVKGTLKPYYKNFSEITKLGFWTLSIIGSIIIYKKYKRKIEKFKIENYLTLGFFISLYLVILLGVNSVVWLLFIGQWQNQCEAEEIISFFISWTLLISFLYTMFKSLVSILLLISVLRSKDKEEKKKKIKLIFKHLKSWLVLVIVFILDILSKIFIPFCL